MSSHQFLLNGASDSIVLVWALCLTPTTVKIKWHLLRRLPISFLPGRVFRIMSQDFTYFIDTAGV